MQPPQYPTMSKINATVDKPKAKLDPKMVQEGLHPETSNFDFKKLRAQLLRDAKNAEYKYDLSHPLGKLERAVADLQIQKEIEKAVQVNREFHDDFMKYQEDRYPDDMDLTRLDYDIEKAESIVEAYIESFKLTKRRYEEMGKRVSEDGRVIPEVGFISRHFRSDNPEQYFCKTIDRPAHGPAKSKGWVNQYYSFENGKTFATSFAFVNLVDKLGNRGIQSKIENGVLTVYILEDEKSNTFKEFTFNLEEENPDLLLFPFGRFEVAEIEPKKIPGYCLELLFPMVEDLEKRRKLDKDISK